MIKPADVAGAIPQYWLNQGIGALRNLTVIGQLIRRDFNIGEFASVGDTVKIPKRGSVTVRDKTPGQPITVDSPETEMVDVVLDQHKYASWGAEDITSAKAIQAGLDYTMDVVIGLGEAIETVCQGLYPGAGDQIGAANTALSYDTILDGDEALTEQKCPMTGRIWVVPPKDKKALMKEPEFVQAHIRNDQGDALRNAQLGRLAGFDFYESQLVPATTGPTARHGMAFHPNAMALVSRPMPIPQGLAGIQSYLLPDPVTGIILRFIRGYSITDLGWINVIDCLFGAKMVDERLAIEALS